MHPVETMEIRASGAAQRAPGGNRLRAPDRPDGLMVFDGLCNFCSARVRWLLRVDRAGAIRFCPLQSPYGRYLAERHGIDAEDPSTFLFFDRGRVLRDSAAALAVARRLPRPWRWLGAAALLPRPLRDGAYRWIARHRYAIAGRRDTCMVPSPEERARFVEQVPAQGAAAGASSPSVKAPS